MFAKMTDRTIIVGLLLLQLSVFIMCQSTPAITNITQEQIKDIGESVELSCSVIYAGDYHVHWVKHNPDRTTLTISASAMLIVRESRFSIRVDDAAKAYVLQIKDLQETDFGVYECKIVKALESIASATVQLLIRQPPFINDNSTRAVVVKEGEAVQLNCWANGVPKPRITWRKESNGLLSTGGTTYRGVTLRIPAVRKEDRGTYYCIAENGVGRRAKRNINLQVQFAPIVTASRPRTGQALQYDMDLECQIDAYPLPAITWIKDNIELRNDQHYQVSHMNTSNDHTDSVLHVTNVEKIQYGQYSCKATNTLGSNATTIELFETEIPICVPACGDNSNGTGSFVSSPGLLLAVISASLVMMN